MQYRARVSIPYAMYLAVAALVLAGCAKTQKTPPLEATSSKPAEKNWMEKTGDATWQVVTTPVRVLTPAKKPKPAPAEPGEPPELVIVTRRGNVIEEAPATQP